MTYQDDMFSFFLGVSEIISAILLLTLSAYVFLGWLPFSFTTISILGVFILPLGVITTGYLYRYA